MLTCCRGAFACLSGAFACLSGAFACPSGAFACVGGAFGAFFSIACFSGARHAGPCQDRQVCFCGGICGARDLLFRGRDTLAGRNSQTADIEDPAPAGDDEEPRYHEC